MSRLSKSEAKKLQRFHDDGLVWLVNTAVLHPRGWALTIHLDDDGTATGLSVQGDGLEPWCFSPGEMADVVARYERAEAQRERGVAAALEQKATPDESHGALL